MKVDTDGSAFAYHPDDLGTSSLCDGLDSYDPTASPKCDSNKKRGSVCQTRVAEAAAAKWDPAKSGPFCMYGFDSPGASVQGTSKKIWGKGFNTGSIPTQLEDDPGPGFFISSTAFSNPDHTLKGARRYIDADTVPYVVIPGKLVGHAKEFPGQPSPAWAWSLKTGNESAAVTGDTQSHFGEGSVALVQALETGAITPVTAELILGDKAAPVPFPYKRRPNGAVRATTGASGTIIFVYFTKAKGVRDLSQDTIKAATKEAFDGFGGEALLKDCIRKLDGAK